MKKDLITVRDVDEQVLRNFKARVIEKRMKMGAALTEAMKKWITEKKEKSINPKNLLRIKPFDWGHGTQRTSKEVDDILYGIK